MESSVAGSRVLVTGAGLVGRRLVERLIAENAKEIRLIDVSAARLAEAPPEVETIDGNINDPDQVIPAMDGVDFVFHTAAVLEGNDVGAYHRVNHRGSEVMATAAAAAEVHRFVHLSSVALYGFADGDAIEDGEPTPTAQAYSMSKAAGEAAVLEIGRMTGLPVVAIRPAAIFGPGSRFFTGTFMKRASKRPIRMVGNGNGSQPVVFIDDVVDLMLTVATHPLAVGEVFNCSIDPPPSQKEYVQAYGKLIGNQSYVGIPTWLVAGAGSVIVPFSKRGTYARQLPRNVRHIDKWVRYPMDKAARVLDWRPQFDVESGVRASVPWLVGQGLLDPAEIAGQH